MAIHAPTRLLLIIRAIVKVSILPSLTEGSLKRVTPIRLSTNVVIAIAVA